MLLYSLLVKGTSAADVALIYTHNQEPQQHTLLHSTLCMQQHSQQAGVHPIPKKPYKIQLDAA